MKLAKQIGGLLLLFIAAFFAVRFITWASYKGAVNFSAITGIGKADWLQFEGAFFGSIITVIGAYFVMELQIERGEKEKRKEEKQQRKMLKKAVVHLVGGEISYNYAVFKTIYYKPFFENKRTVSIDCDLKFNTGEWDQLKHLLLEKLELTDSMIKVFALYRKINAMNDITVKEKRIAYKTRDEGLNQLTEINDLFVQAASWVEEITEQTK